MVERKKQKISVVLARTQCDPMTTWQEVKIVDIEVDDDGNGEWHVTGSYSSTPEELDSSHSTNITNRCAEIGCALCCYVDTPNCDPETAYRAYMPKTLTI